MGHGGYGGGGFHGGGARINVNIGCGYGHEHGGAILVIGGFPHRPCPPRIEGVIYEAGGYERGPGGGVVMERVERPVYIEPRPHVVVAEPYNDRVTPGLRSVSSGDEQNIADAAGALNAINAKTHLTFNMTSDGRAEASTQGLHGFFEKNDLAKVNREAIERGEPDFVQNLLGGPNSAIRFDGKHIVINPGVNQDDVNAVTRNAEALGEAVHGHYEKAHDMYASVQRGNVLTTNGPDKTQPDQGPQQQDQDPYYQAANIDPKDKYREVAKELDNKWHFVNPDGTFGGVADLDKDKVVKRSEEDNRYHVVDPDGNLSGFVPDKNVTRDGPAAAASAAPAAPTPAKAEPVQVAEPTKYEKIELMQLELKMLKDKGFIQHDVNARPSYGIDGNIGRDTKAAEKEILGRTPGEANITEDDFKQITAAFQKDMKINGSGDLNAETLKLLVDEKNKLKDAGVRVVDDVKLDRFAAVAETTAPSMMKDLIGALKKSAEVVGDEMKRRVNGGDNPKSVAGQKVASNGEQPGVRDLVYRSGDTDASGPQTRNAVFTAEDAKAAKIVTTEMKDVKDGTLVTSTPVKPALQQDGNVRFV